MSVKRVQFSNIVQSQLPEYVRDNYPLISDLLKQYYISQEYTSGPLDLIQNIDQYTKIDNLSNTTGVVGLATDITSYSKVIPVDMFKFPQGTTGFPDSYGLIKINDEIITYTGLAQTAFTGCIRGFSGISSYKAQPNPDVLVFESTKAGIHSEGDTITNLSDIFLKEFLVKTKYQILPGLEERQLSEDIDQGVFLKHAKDFYTSKGTDRSFEILFKALYGGDVKIVRPGDYLFTPSNANYHISNNLIVEPIEGDPEDLTDATLYQDEYVYETSIGKGYAPITDIEKIVAVGAAHTFYRLGFDSGYDRDIRVNGALYGNFSVHPKSRLIGDVGVGGTTFNVDSTVGFGNNGEIYVTYDDSSVGVVSYTSKSLNQFYGCTNVLGKILDTTPIGINTFAWGRSAKDPTKRIKVRINSVLSNIKYPDNTSDFGKGDVAQIKTLGVGNTSFKFKNWFYNIAPIYKVKNIELIDNSDNTYRVNLYVTHEFRAGDRAEIVGNDGILKTTNIIIINNDKSFTIVGQGSLPLTDKYTIKRKLLVGESNSFPDASRYTTNVQNVYKEKYTNNLLVASPSIPTYNSVPIDTSDRSVTFSGTYEGDEFDIGNHTFYTGDEVYYIPQKVEEEYWEFGQSTTRISVDSSLFAGDIGKYEDGGQLPPHEGLYFIKRISSTVVKLATSKSDIYNSKFISLDNETIVTDCILKVYSFRFKTLDTQKLLREVKSPIDNNVVTQTSPGFTGILINGVEILNYKSSKVINYGKINNLDNLANGSNYDIINPPPLLIKDDVGIGATGYPAISGSLRKIQIIDPGFDYKEIPLVNISGGNGKNAKAIAKMTLVDHKAAFNAQDTSIDDIASTADVGIGATVSTIGFSTYHKFINAEQVIYITDNQDGLSGLTTNTSYFVSNVNDTRVKLHPTQGDAIAGINTVTISSGGVGRQYLQSYDKKSQVESITILNSGSGYQTKKRTASSATGINTSSNIITIENHGYEKGEIVKYTTEGTSIGGLTDGTEYYVTKIDDNKFKLSTSEALCLTEQYVGFTSVGTGTQVFNYQDIVVELIGSIGISSIGSETFKAQIQPIFRGEITSVHLSNTGVGYGSSSIIGYDKQPDISLISGSDAQTKAITENGKIVEVLILNGGSNYTSIPDLLVEGDGSAAVLTPIIKDGSLSSINIISGGSGYNDASTTVAVISAGIGAKFRANIQSWRVNLFQKYFNNFTDDDGFITRGINDKLGLQYSNLYAPRRLRESVFSLDQSGTVLYGNSDLKKADGIEVKSTDHSPILGWAYDGNPIYGPYGYSMKSGGVVTQMKSGYKEEASIKENRPSLTEFPGGFFVEDFTYYEVTDESTLDKNNGRFGITPDFPNGTYAYFATLDNSDAAQEGPFNKYKIPVFPYFIGENYYSLPNDFNYNYHSNQDDIDLNNSNWCRNTLPYNLIEDDLRYEYVYIPNSLDQTMSIKGVSPGDINTIGIETGGNFYKIGDQVVFNNQKTDGEGLSAKVSNIVGKSISKISVASSSISDVEIYPSNTNGEYIIFADNPHNWENLDVISVSGLSTTSSKIEGSYTAGISSNVLSLSGLGTFSGIATDVVGISSAYTTGIVTYFNVNGNLSYPNIRENDILGIGSERVKVLNVDSKLSRIRVLREYDGTIGHSHTTGKNIYEDSRRLTIDAGFKTDYNYRLNRQIYFNPLESVGLGTTAGVGIGTTISFGNPGAGITELFIQSKAIYIPDHGLRTGDKLTYSPGNGDPIQYWVTPSSGASALTDGQILYAASINSDLVGIATLRVGLGSTGDFVGIASTTTSTLFFSGIGTGVYHSFKTNYSPITGEIDRQLVTVATSQTHGLTTNDTVSIDVNPSTASTFAVKYNDYNRRVLVGIKTFTAAGINTASNTITLTDHGFKTGEKIVYTATTPLNGLSNHDIYYIVKIDNNNFKLSNTYYNSIQEIPSIVGFGTISITDGSDTSGSIGPINPALKVYKDSTVTFDLSDPSLSYTNQSTLYPAFEFNFYTDSDYVKVWDKNTTIKDFNVARTGIVGISTNAKVSLTVNSNNPEILYYRLDPTYEGTLPEIKKQIIIDSEVISNNEVQVNTSGYNGKHVVSLPSTTSFTYTLGGVPESVSYATTTGSIISYETDSLSALGEIAEFEITNVGRNYYNLPGITTVRSVLGSGADIKTFSDSIGKINQIEINNIGFDFPSDTTLSPSIGLPQNLRIIPLMSLESIGISSGGRGYSTAPSLLLIDGKTKKVISDVDLEYSLGDSKVTILRNTNGIYNTPPTILPYDNSNGVGIKTVSYDESAKIVTVTMSVGFSTAFPFAVDDKVMIEGVSVGVGSDAKGYDSANYNYKLFTITEVDGNLGGLDGTVKYSLDDELAEGILPGTYDTINSSGRIIPEKYFPIFNTQLKSNDFLLEEDVKEISVDGDEKIGIVNYWNNITGVLKLSSNKDFNLGKIVEGTSSKTRGLISSVKTAESYAETNAFSNVKGGWRTNSGMLNDNIQRLQDGSYYQNFSYSLSSQVYYNTWNDAVSALNHTLGFRKFADYQLESSATERISVGLSSDTTSVDIVRTLDGFANLNCVYGFDLVKENSLNLNGRSVSTEIIFANRILQDFMESVGNRVLNIDDISSQFNSHPRPTEFGVVDRFVLSDIRSRKFIMYVQDKSFTSQRQLMLVDLIHDGSQGYMNQYGRVETTYDLGSFDFKVNGLDGEILFYPTNYTINDYWVTPLSYNLDDNLLSTGSTSIGGLALVSTSSTTTTAGIGTTTIVSIANTYSSAKVLIEVNPDISMNDNEFEFAELNIVHNGSDVAMVDYGKLTTNLTSFPASGYGTYYPYLENSLLKVDFIPNTGIGTTAVINTITVGITSVLSGTSGVGTITFPHTKLEAVATTISASGSPTENVICEYDGDYEASYCIVQVRDLTNNEYQLSEFAVVGDDAGNTYDVEWANIETSAGLGTLGSRATATGVEIVFTPLPSIDVEAVVFMNALEYEINDYEQIDFNNGTIKSGFGEYTGTHSDIKRSFTLTHNTEPIFERYFLGNDSSIINVIDNEITIPNHFYVSGEKVTYKHVGTATSAIQCAATNFPGVGSTEYLPEELFIVKVNDDTISIARNAEDALLKIPTVVDLTSVGIGTSHRFIATNQNAKVITAIDNLIQSPIVSTAVTTHLADEALITDTLIEFAGITSFYGADLIKVGDEIMKIETVGIGTSTNRIQVRRSWLGTTYGNTPGEIGFATGTLITKVIGNYNIIDNVLNFTEAPNGNRPIGSTTNPPDDRDWVGITTSSTFQGRTFMRSGVSGSSTDTYSNNLVFDGISDQFNGIDNEFTLKSNGSNVTGITSEGIVLVNDIWQARATGSNYTIEESSGISSITFVGTYTPISYDTGLSPYPVGGVILSVGSSEGFGYQPLVAAGATVTVSSAGTVSTLSIGYSGSGYRSGVGQTVNISIQQESLTGVDVVSIGTAIIGSTGSLTGTAITNPHVFYKPKTITNVGYNSITGMSTVTTLTKHGLSVGNEVKLSGIAFTCTYSGPKSITNVGYHTATGIMTVTTSGAHGYSVDQDVIFTGIAMTCQYDPIIPKYYPRGEDPAYDNAISIASTTGTTITVDVGYGAPTDQFAHTFVSAATSAVISGGDYAHQFVSAANNSVIAGGNYVHTYSGNGVGIITVTGIGSTTPTGATYNPSTGDLVLTIESHSYNTNNTIGIGTHALIFTCSMDGNVSDHYYPRPSDPIIGVTTAITAVTSDTITVNVGVSTLVYYTPTDATYTPSTGELTLSIGSHALTGPSTHTVINAEYNPVSGIMTVYPTVGSAYSFSSGDKIKFDDDSLTFSCSYGSGGNKTYPRSGAGTTNDPLSGTWRSVTGIGSTAFEVQVLDTVPSSNTSVHTFVSAVTGGLQKMGESITIPQDSLTFRCAMDNYASLHNYPRSSDPGFSTSLGITTATTDTITVNVGISTLVYHNVSAADYSANVGVMTMTIGAHTLKSGESIKLATESLSFTCTKDSGITTHKYPRKPDPYYGGSRITSVPSTTQFVTNIGISTVETFYVSGGKVQGAIIAPRAVNNSESKIDPASGQATINAVLDEYNFIVPTGISTRSHFYARSGKVDKPLKVIFDSPVSYSDMALTYSSSYGVGLGSAATVDIQVGQGSSIIDFEIKDTGYGFGNGDVLTVSVGGTTGIPTTSNYAAFREFNITIDSTFGDKFTGWTVGQLQTLDNVEKFINGTTTNFPLSVNGSVLSIMAAKGSKIDVEQVIFVFVNDILQIPGQGYKFPGGSVITFTEAPKVGDTIKISFYKGSGDIDVLSTEVLETVKEGDDLTIGYDPNKDQNYFLQENPRAVISIDSTNITTTVPYFGPGNTNDINLLRPVDWCRQTEDKIINEKPVGKIREWYEPVIKPCAYIIKSVGIGSTTIYIDNLRPFFDPQNESVVTVGFQNKITFVRQETKTGAAATAVVSGLGTISSVVISDGGVGYTTATVSIASTVGVGTTSQAFGAVTIGASGAVTGVAITSPGVGYTNTNVPQVLITPPSVKTETNSVGSYVGDSGVIVGVGTTVNGAQAQLIFDLHIPYDSDLRNTSLTGTAITFSSLSPNDYFMVFESNAGAASTSITSLDVAGSTTVGIGTSFIDNVYAVSSNEAIQTSISGITTYVNRVFVNTSTLMVYGSGITTSDYMGEFSWGRIDLTSRSGINSYTSYTLGGIGTVTSGISTSMIVERFVPLKSKNYSV